MDFQVDRINLRTLKKYSMPAMQIARRKHGMSIENDRIYIAGGEGNCDVILKSLEK